MNIEMQAEVSDRLRGAFGSVAGLAKLLYRLTRDPRVPRRNKIVLGGIAAYLLLPFDLVPDWVPGIGQVDDIVLVVVALDLMINKVPDHVLHEHWDGDPQTLVTIQRILSTATAFVPDRVKRTIVTGADDLIERF